MKHLHDLRREGISRLLEKGYSPHEVAMVSGHKTLDILRSVYSALKPELLHKGPMRHAATERGLP